MGVIETLDSAAWIARNGFAGALADRGVMRAGAGLDYTACQQLAGKRTAHGALDIDGNLKAVLEASEAGFVVAIRVRKLRPPAERLPMLHLGFGPLQGKRLKRGIAKRSRTAPGITAGS